MKKILIAALLLSPVLTWAQASSSLYIDVTNEMIKTQSDGTKAIDLIGEIKKQRPGIAASGIEIQMLRVQAKSGIGGAQIYFMINSDYVATAVVETNPDQFLGNDLGAFANFELKNIDRSQIRSALLQLQASNNVKLKSIEVVIGSVQEPVVFGRYAQDQASVIGGVDDSEFRDMRPTDAALAAIYGTYYGNDVDVVAAQQEAEQKAIAEAQQRAEQDRILLQQQREEELRAEQERIRLRDEYYAQIQRQEEEQARLRREALDRQTVQDNSYQCLKTKKKKITGRKEICVGDIISGVWQGLTPKVIKVNVWENTITVLFDYSPQPVDLSVDTIPNAR